MNVPYFHQKIPQFNFGDYKEWAICQVYVKAAKNYYSCHNETIAGKLEKCCNDRKNFMRNQECRNNIVEAVKDLYNKNNPAMAQELAEGCSNGVFDRFLTPITLQEILSIISTKEFQSFSLFMISGVIASTIAVKILAKCCPSLARCCSALTIP